MTERYRVRVLTRFGVVTFDSDTEPRVTMSAGMRYRVTCGTADSALCWLDWNQVVAVTWKKVRTRARMANGSREIDFG